MKRVLVIGGYGNFGRFISRRLAQDPNIILIIGGRRLEKSQALANELKAQAVLIDIQVDIRSALEKIKPDIVIHTSGPFQLQGYEVAEACIAAGAHYVDLADGREFVAGINKLDEQARDAKVLVISGASSVPCLTSALIDDYKKEFATLDSLDYGITTAQQTTRGLATTAAILSYTGKPFKTLINGELKNIYGWQDLHTHHYSGLGQRWLCNCNIPDLEIFPTLYPELKTIRFYAGLELPFIHITLWMLSWLVRIGLVKSLVPAASLLLKLSFLFDRFGSADSGFHMQLSGMDHNNCPKRILFELIACDGDGPYIPCMPAVILAKKLASGSLKDTGAKPCIGIISKDEYLQALQGLNISWRETV